MRPPLVQAPLSMMQGTAMQPPLQGSAMQAPPMQGAPIGAVPLQGNLAYSVPQQPLQRLGPSLPLEMPSVTPPPVMMPSQSLSSGNGTPWSQSCVSSCVQTSQAVVQGQPQQQQQQETKPQLPSLSGPQN